MATWKRRKERIATDPEFRRRVYRQQAEARRRRTQRQQQGVATCDVLNAAGRRCGRLIGTHQHAG